MFPFILRRLGLAIPTLIAVSFLVFIAARMAPSDPIEIMLGEKAAEQAVALLRSSIRANPLPKMPGASRDASGDLFAQLCKCALATPRPVAFRRRQANVPRRIPAQIR